MDFDELAKHINQPRSATVRLTLVSGDKYDLPPGSHVFLQGIDTLLVLWPAVDYRIARSLTVAGVNVASVETLSQQAA